MLDSKNFQKQKLNQKINELRKHGEFLTKRNYLHYEVFLYLYNDFFVEVWKTISFGDIFSIDTAPSRSVKETYLNSIDLKKLGLEI